MNNNAQGGQPPQGQPAQAGQQQQGQPPQRKAPPFFKAEQMRQLPAAQFSQADKEKYERGLTNLWNQMNSFPPDSKEHLEAKKKISDFSNTLFQKIRTFAAQQQQQAQQQAQQQQAQQQQNAQQAQAQNAAQRPPTTQPTQPAQAQQTVDTSANAITSANANATAPPTTAATATATAPVQNTQRPTQPTIPKHILDHVNNFPYIIPPQFPIGSTEAIKFKAEQRGKLVRGLMAMENATSRIKSLDEARQQKIAAGNALTPDEEKDYTEKKEAAQKGHSDAKRFVEHFRAQNNVSGNANSQTNAASQQSNNNQGQEGAARPQLNTQQPGPGVSNPALQSTQTVNAAIEAARNQQLNGGRSLSQSGQGQSIPPQNGSNNTNMSQQASQVQHPPVKQEPGPPQINTAVNQFQNQHRNSIGNNSPQSALPQSATQQHPPGPPRALSHAAALSQANRSYSSGIPSAGPSVMGHSHPSAPSGTRESQNVMTSKMPIPKHLPERATNTPQPVAMAPSRPTYTGGAGNGNSIGAQPVIHQPPNIGNLAENGGRVLDKNKLEELVRQVTGGGQGLEGGGNLTPDVESSIMDVADNFVDQVLEAACRNAKERGSKILEIRDIQLTLERGYNIRIPGYASDEIRTVRKIAPSPQWIAKMSAVQAAKVTGGKNAD